MSDNKGEVREEVTLEEASRTSSVEGGAGEDSLRKAQESGSDGLEAGVEGDNAGDRQGPAVLTVEVLEGKEVTNSVMDPHHGG